MGYDWSDCIFMVNLLFWKSRNHFPEIGRHHSLNVFGTAILLLLQVQSHLLQVKGTKVPLRLKAKPNGLKAKPNGLKAKPNSLLPLYAGFYKKGAMKHYSLTVYI